MRSSNTAHPLHEAVDAVLPLLLREVSEALKGQLEHPQYWSFILMYHKEYIFVIAAYVCRNTPFPPLIAVLEMGIDY